MEEQIRYVFETNNIGVKDGNLNVDDVIETANHFRLVSLIIDNAKSVLTEEFIEGLHLLLKSGASDSRRRAAMNISKKNMDSAFSLCCRGNCRHLFKIFP